MCGRYVSPDRAAIESTAATEELEHYPVSTVVNNASSDGEKLIEKMDLE
jgi:putative SOS response-associated peptidase YedK